MGYAQSYTADVQAVAVAASDGSPGRAKDAEASLRQVHRDLPEMVRFSSEMLGHSGIDVGASRATSHRLTEALMRELAVAPQGALVESDKKNIERSALRSVLVQEGAAHEFEQRTGRPDAFREFMGDRAQVNGLKAMETLERQKVDTVALYGQASDVELTQMSVGAFDRTGRAQQERTARGLEVPLERMEQRSAGVPAPSASVARSLPVRGAVTRRPLADVRRPAPSFGRKVQPELAASHAY
jgi:hypothetical protein